MADEKKTGDVWGNLIGIGILLFIVHWFAAGFMAGGIFSECKENNPRYNERICDCQTSELRNSLATEQLIIASINDEDTPPAVRRTFFRIASVCK